MTFDEVFELFKDNKNIAKKLKLMIAVGLGYLVLRQPSVSLSGGEVQRLKMVKELAKTKRINSLYILDEPSIGLHMEDISNLVLILQQLVGKKNTVLIVEHETYILAQCDWLIELGPVGGPDGGFIVGEGTPEAIANLETPTAPYLKEILEVKN